MDEVRDAATDLREGRLAWAEARLAGLLQKDPDNLEALKLKVEICLRKQNPRQAAALMERIAALEAYPNRLLAAAGAHRQSGDFGATERALLAYLELRPGEAQGVLALAETYYLAGQLGKAKACLDQWPLPPSMVFHRLSARILSDLGRTPEALEHLEEAFQMGSDQVWVEYLNLQARQMDPEGECYRQALGKYLPDTYKQWIDPRTNFPAGDVVDRRLRVGYVSSNFTYCPVASFLLDMLPHHDRAKFDVTLFAEIDRPDGNTRRFMDMGFNWVPTLGRGDQELAAAIRLAGIDILVDLNGFSNRHRLGIFSLRAAPIQVVYGVGYGPTRGMPNLDVKFTDALADPPGLADEWNTETLIRLQGPRTSFSWPDPSPPVGPLPCRSGAPFTFGSLTTAYKLNDAFLDVVAAILAAEPEARYLCLWPSAVDAEGIAFRKGQLVSRGVRADQVEVLPKASLLEYLAYYDRVDLVLDPFPFWGLTTVLEAMWMGVPVLHFDPTGAVRHPGRAFYPSIGMGDWRVESTEDYVATARSWLRRRDELAEIRKTLRPRLLASSLADGPAVARTLESAYRELWVDWCEGRFPYRTQRLSPSTGARP